MKARKRAPGAGRKPQGSISGKRSIFSTRITDATRAALESESHRRGQSISQVAERILQKHFEDTAAEGDAPMKAFCYLVSEAARSVTGISNANWLTDPFMFKAFETTLQKLLDYLRPTGDMKPPEVDPLIFDLFDTPEKRAHIAYSNIVTALETYDPRTVSEKEWSELQSEAGRDSRHIRQLSGYSSARRALKSK